MNAADRSELLQILQGRCDTIADSWYQAIARTSHVPHSKAEVRDHLVELTEQAIALLLMDVLEHIRAEAIGASLARLQYTEAEDLGRTQGVLAQQIVEGLPAEQVVALQPRLAALLGGLAAGFFQQVRGPLLAEQEQDRGALISDLQRAEGTLRKAHDDGVEWRVQERAAELAVVNEKLRREIAERKRAEEALRESEETARALLNAPTDVAALIDTGGIILDANETMARRFRRRVEELIGSCVWDLFPSDMSERRKAQVSKVIQSGKPVRFEDEREGMWNDNVIYPVLDTQGKVTKVAVLARDITERKRTEEELLCSQEEVLHNHHLLLALSQAVQAVQRAHTPEEVYRTIGDKVAGLGYHAVVFALADDHEHVTLSHTTFEPVWLRTVEELSGLSVLGFRFPLAPDGLFQRVIAEGESAFCERTAELVAKGLPELGLPLIERLTEMLGIEKSIYVPLRVSGETHGLLGVASTGLAEADVPAVTVFANQAGIAIENAQLLGQVSASRERLRQLAQQIVSAQEERQRLSHALHDEAGQALTALRISLELIQDDLPVEFDLLRQRIGDAAALTDATMEQIRLLARDLRPPALDAVGLNPTLEAFCRDFAKRTQLPIDYLGLGLPMLPEAVNMCLYRFLQEALTNVAKHACADQVCVTLCYDAETVSLSVEDDGRGFDKKARLSVLGWPMGIGLLGMQERLESLGGRLEIESQPGQGTRLVAHLPAGGTT
jgi:PAS domain S-box-containing protein